MTPPPPPLSPGLLLVTVITATVAAVDRHITELAGNSQAEVTSAGFPVRCCVEATHTLVVAPDWSAPGFIRLLFTDLDLPPGSALHLYDGNSSKADAFAYQPEMYSRGEGSVKAWLREGIQSSGRSIHLHFIPGDIEEDDDVIYTGFKAVAWVTSSLNWHHWPFSGDCPLVQANSSRGGMMTLRVTHDNDSSLAEHADARHRGAGSSQLQIEGVEYDCVWQIKPPPPGAGRRNYGVYARVTDFRVQSFDESSPAQYELEVVQGLASVGAKLNQDPDNPDQDDDTTVREGATFHSLDGLYIRARVPLSVKDFLFRVIYGPYYDPGPKMGQVIPKEEGDDDAEEKECGDGFLCDYGRHTWCLPEQNKCDGNANCGNNMDEDMDMCLAYQEARWREVEEFPPEIEEEREEEKEEEEKKIEEIVDKCEYDSLQKRCPDGTCIQIDDVCGEDCPWDSRQCNNGECVDFNTGRCSDEPCPDQTPFMCDGGYTCLYMQYVCDQQCTCNDCADNAFMRCGVYAYISLNNLRICLFVFVPFVIVFFIYHAYRQKNKLSWGKFSNTSEPENVALESTKTSMNLTGEHSPRNSLHQHASLSHTTSGGGGGGHKPASRTSSNRSGGGSQRQHRGRSHTPASDVEANGREGLLPDSLPQTPPPPYDEVSGGDAEAGTEPLLPPKDAKKTSYASIEDEQVKEKQDDKEQDKEGCRQDDPVV